ncbi:MAG: UDP-3-O-(3-hydroxymyristoyl)glucosamine N-acyltransferase [Planctomycetes bacterium]|nr:UDP-3-O-(3-hydroxymyristoyl)glucosamine N-acyltransferase [Planctomycetota bacterium]
MTFAPHTLKEIAAFLDCTVRGNLDLSIKNLASLKEAGEGELSFLANPKYAPYLQTTQASAVIVAKDFNAEAPCALLLVDNPDQAFSRVAAFMAPPPPGLPLGIHPSAVVAENVKLGSDLAIAANVVIDKGVIIGDRVQIWPGVYLGEGAAIGNDSVLLPNVVVCHGCTVGERVILHPGVIIGSDGFGYVSDKDGHTKIPQLGCAVIEDDVEIGANTVVDRARFGKTVVGRGTKLDNLIQIAHNVELGEKCAFAAQSGVAGSTKVGAGTLMAGQSGISGHLEIAPGSLISAGAVVTKSLPGRAQYTGYPAREHKEFLEGWRNIKSLGRLRKTIKELERRIAELET